MRSQVEVMEDADFEAWLQEQAAENDAGGENQGASVFERQGCGGCHVFEAAGAGGQTGPSLDELEASAEEAGEPLEEFVRESIVTPNAYLHPGYADLMPKTFSELPDDQLDALVQYLVGEAQR